jgi:uncharacterized membrane protein
VTRLSTLRLRLWWQSAFWVIPVLGVAAGWLLDYLSVFVDEAAYESGEQGAQFSTSAATTLLSAVAGGMVTFTGFVFSVVLLVLQFGSTQYSPRTVSYFLRSRRIQWVLAIFLATIVFSTFSVLEVGSAGRDEFVPVASVIIAVWLLLISLGAFLVLLNTVSRRIRVDTVLSDIGEKSRRQMTRRATLASELKAEPVEHLPAAARDARLIRFAGEPGQIVAVDAKSLRRLARRLKCQITLLVRTGDSVSVGSHIAMVSGGRARDRRVSRCLLTADERSLSYDPLYALRILSDVALRALSPGTNDPTTAVRALDEVEGVLRAASPLQLGPVRLPAGEGSVILRSPTWADITDLALLEVVDAGLSQFQVTRRLTAMLNDLLADLPEERHKALLRYKRRLAQGIETLPAEYQAVAHTGDRQGIGGSR